MTPNVWPDIDPLPYIRLNPDLGSKPPLLDAKHELQPLKDKVAKELKRMHLKVEIERIAFQLVASTFYFAKQHSFSLAEESEAQVYKGKSSF